MRLSLIILLGFLAHGQADPTDRQWQAPRPSDLRSPCPMLNALANHGYLPRDGRNIDTPTINKALSEGPNFDPAAFSDVVIDALSTSTTGNRSTFNLDDTAKHNIIEHDGSLSRDDIAHGDNLHFSPDIWAQVASHFTENTISIEVAAKARADRIANAKATNPNFYFLNNSTAGLGETSFYQILFGDRVHGNARTLWVRVFFEQERLPFAEGYERTDEPITLDDILYMLEKVKDASPIESQVAT